MTLQIALWLNHSFNIQFDIGGRDSFALSFVSLRTKEKLAVLFDGRQQMVSSYGRH
jgi:hypothetical protein